MGKYYSELDHEASSNDEDAGALDSSTCLNIVIHQHCESSRTHNTEFNPTILPADTAAAITNGFKEVFQLVKQYFCWAHVKRAVDGKLNEVSDKQVKNRIISNIVNFQHYVETVAFTVVASLMICSWRDKFPGNQEVETFIAYFIKQWLNPKRMS